MFADTQQDPYQPGPNVRLDQDVEFEAVLKVGPSFHYINEEGRRHSGCQRRCNPNVQQAVGFRGGAMSLLQTVSHGRNNPAPQCAMLNPDAVLMPFGSPLSYLLQVALAAFSPPTTLNM